MVAFDGDVWMTLGFDREVVRLDARSGRVARRVKVANRPVRVAVDESGLWVGTEIDRRRPPRAVGRTQRPTGAGAAL